MIRTLGASFVVVCGCLALCRGHSAYFYVFDHQKFLVLRTACIFLVVMAMVVVDGTIGHVSVRRQLPVSSA